MTPEQARDDGIHDSCVTVALPTETCRGAQGGGKEASLT